MGRGWQNGWVIVIGLAAAAAVNAGDDNPLSLPKIKRLPVPADSKPSADRPKPQAQPASAANAANDSSAAKKRAADDELSSPSSGGYGAYAPSSKSSSSGRGGNWLVEAMSKPAGAVDSAASNDPLSASDPTKPSSPNDPLAIAAAPPDSRSAVTAKPDTAPTANPLKDYMATWMTPKDYALLKPKTSTTSTTSADSLGSLDGTPRAESGAKLANGGQANGGKEKRVNPYLESVNPAPAPKSATNDAQLAPPLTLVPPTPTAQPAPGPNLQAPPPDSKTPAPFRPANDSKYFPQLKRF